MRVPATLLVMAKAPVPGRVKTRLCPPLDPAEAAAVARAALEDTLRAVLAASARRRVVALDGATERWPSARGGGLGGPPCTTFPDPRGEGLAPPSIAGFDVIPQRGADLGARLAAACVEVGGPVLAVGMDTPQLTAAVLDDALARLASVDAVLGPAADGGYWAIGLAEPREEAFAGVPMSSPDTCAAQRARLQALGLRVADLAPLRDVDTFADAVAVADEAPATRFAQVVRPLRARRSALP